MSVFSIFATFFHIFFAYFQQTFLLQKAKKLHKKKKRKIAENSLTTTVRLNFVVG